MRRTAGALLLLGAALVVVSLVLPARPARCLVTADGTPSGTCLDARLTGRADGYVSSIDSETPGVPLWYVTFDAGGATVQAKSSRWPAAPGGPVNGPRVGQAVHVAYDPAAPAEHATDADALAALDADRAAGRAGGGASGAAVALRWLGGLLALAGLAGTALAPRRNRGGARPVPPVGDPDAPDAAHDPADPTSDPDDVLDPDHPDDPGEPA